MIEADESLRDLLDRLNRGEERAAREVFEAYGPYLRMIVRRRMTTSMRSKLDSEDIIQSVWADLIDVFRQRRGHFTDAKRLRSFLIRAACNRLIDRQRQHSSALLRERSIDGDEPDLTHRIDLNRPEDLAVADELWDRILASCPPVHRDLIRLKREGLGVAEIAERADLHPSSVRRILYDLARRMGIAQATATPGQRTS